MKNEQFIQQFIDDDDLDTDLKKSNQNIFYEGNVLYDYGYHFPLALKLNDGFILLNKDGYSNTTARHKSILKGKVSEDKRVFMTTQELKRVIQQYPRVKDIKEIICNKLDEVKQ